MLWQPSERHRTCAPQQRSLVVRFCTNQTIQSQDLGVESTELSLAEIRKRRRQVSKEKKKAARARRRLTVGKAKGVDRGLYKVTYKPGGDDGKTFSALSGLPDRTKLFTVLGIESSCDDTGAAVVRSDGVILGEALASQTEIHEVWGGIKPDVARDAHEEHIDAVVAEALEKAGMSSAADVDAISATVGPGLDLCLRIGCNKGRDLAMEFQKPFVAVHHLEAHILMARIPLAAKDESSLFPVPATKETHASTRALQFPFLAMLVSGGHCQIIRCRDIGSCDILGGTMDDSMGEAFDKIARLLGFPVGGGGGPAVERIARNGNKTAVELPIPLCYKPSFDFSYAGLKTAVRIRAQRKAAEYNLERTEDLPDEFKADLAASFQHRAIQHVQMRLKYAMELVEKEGINQLALVGGVAANTELRSRLEDFCASRETPWTLFVPLPKLCTDQGTMIAWAAIERIMKGSTDEPSNRDVYARYPFAISQNESNDPSP